MTCPIPAAAATLPSSHGAQAPSDWIARFAHLVRPQGQVLDIACGLGRHMRMFHASNHPVTGIDRAQEAIDAVANLGQAIQADIENPLSIKLLEGAYQPDSTIHVKADGDRLVFE